MIGSDPRHSLHRAPWGMTPSESRDERTDPALMRERMKRWSPPVNELPLPVVLPTVVFRSDRFAVGLSGEVYSTGLSLSLSLRQASHGRDDRRLFQRIGPRTSLPADEQLFVGVELADGRRVVLADPVSPREADEGPQDTLLMQRAGQPLGDTAFTMLLWLTPVPPPGPTTLVVRCPAVGLPETAVKWDGAPIAEAAASIVPLWPTPEPPAAPRTPPRPTDGWFAASRPAPAPPRST